jgi:hypothetical protein
LLGLFAMCLCLIRTTCRLDRASACRGVGLRGGLCMGIEAIGRRHDGRHRARLRLRHRHVSRPDVHGRRRTCSHPLASLDLHATVGRPTLALGLVEQGALSIQVLHAISTLGAGTIDAGRDNEAMGTRGLGLPCGRLDVEALARNALPLGDRVRLLRRGGRRQHQRDKPKDRHDRSPRLT